MRTERSRTSITEALGENTIGLAMPDALSEFIFNLMPGDSEDEPEEKNVQPMAEVAFDLACPVCFELPAGEVHQCFEGHCYCVDCWRRLLTPVSAALAGVPSAATHSRSGTAVEPKRQGSPPCRPSATTATRPQRAVLWRSTCAPASSGPSPAQRLRLAAAWRGWRRGRRQPSSRCRAG